DAGGIHRFLSGKFLSGGFSRSQGPRRGSPPDDGCGHPPGKTASLRGPAPSAGPDDGCGSGRSKREGSEPKSERGVGLAGTGGTGPVRVGLGGAGLLVKVIVLPQDTGPALDLVRNMCSNKARSSFFVEPILPAADGSRVR